MRPRFKPALWLAACAALPGCATEPTDVRAAAWATETRIEAAPFHPPEPKPAARIRTASLAPVRPPVPAGSLTGSHALAGIASFYWQEQRTASGEAFDKMALTAAHPTLPFGTRVKVTNRNNGRTVVVRINDRGPFKPGRVIDLSYAAADAIDMRAKGLVPVRLEVVQ